MKKHKKRPAAVNGDMPIAHVEEVTPAQAKDLLDNWNKDNRPIGWEKVRQIAASISAGQFIVSPNPITLDTAGYVLDGQHRLAACVLAGQSMKCYVLRDFPRKQSGVESFLVCNGSRPNSNGFLMGRLGYHGGANRLCAIARNIFCLENSFTLNGWASISATETREILESYSLGFEFLAEEIPEHGGIIKMPAPTLAPIVIGVQAGTVFAHAAKSLGRGLMQISGSEDSPVKRLARWLNINCHRRTSARAASTASCVVMHHIYCGNKTIGRIRPSQECEQWLGEMLTVVRKREMKVSLSNNS